MGYENGLMKNGLPIRGRN